ncbi:MAG: ribosomal L7Ae/L30e/S12e/Gadd45 family protein [Syntrophomonas sp.]|nr:ribosomal L7Ae/L30e/S12e/Gadd45 family protein [Syntrophomonas sp.]
MVILQRVYNLIGIAQRAGKVSSGAMAARNSIIRHRAYILLVSEDIAENTRETLIKNCNKQKIPWLGLGNKYEIGASIGKAYRVAITINDAGMADAILKAAEEAAKVAKTMGVD